MPGTVVVGLQWGDEGKGKVVDYFAGKADLVVRFNGGANAGHTVIVKGKVHKFHLMPSGVLSGKRVMLAAGMVVDPEVLLSEIDAARKAAPKLNLLIDGKAHVVTPYAKLVDGAADALKGKYGAGTTKRGIGPTYADKADRLGLRMCDITGSSEYSERAKFLQELKRKIAGVYGLGDEAAAINDFIEQYADYGRKLAPFMGDVAFEVNSALAKKKKVLFEGAQGSLLDIDHGVYPYTTSSNTISGAACSLTGVPPMAIASVAGVVKAYTSRVGSGPLVTELDGALADKIREKGKEYGTTTGRPRRIGWLDLVAVKYACMLNGTSHLCMTKLDTLSGLHKVKVCTAYELDSKRTALHPQRASELARCKPVYKEFAGWPDPGAAGWREIARKGYKALHPDCRCYLEFIARECGAKLAMVSIGPGREDTILLKNVF
ncbi:Adenylosuccinate synthetase [Candidatus Burarchaeum australiense]|nr:Adenylosuccinate synthetase [Candidatus Burarchaeum australiense]